jgi:hypothetical protein
LDILDIIENLQNSKYSKTLGTSLPAYSFTKKIYESPSSSNITELIILTNSSESSRLSLHYIKYSNTSKLLENISPVPESLQNISISDLNKLYSLDLYKSFKKVQILSAQVQRIHQFERRFSLVELFYIGDGNIYRFFAVLDKQQVISQYKWQLTSNHIKKIESSSIQWEFFSFSLSFIAGVTFVYIFWVKTSRFPLLSKEA